MQGGSSQFSALGVWAVQKEPEGSVLAGAALRTPGCQVRVINCTCHYDHLYYTSSILIIILQIKLNLQNCPHLFPITSTFGSWFQCEVHLSHQKTWTFSETFLVVVPARPRAGSSSSPTRSTKEAVPCSAGLCSPRQLERALPWAELKLFSCFLFFITSFCDLERQDKWLPAPVPRGETLGERNWALGTQGSSVAQLWAPRGWWGRNADGSSCGLDWPSPNSAPHREHSCSRNI